MPKPSARKAGARRDAPSPAAGVDETLVERLLAAAEQGVEQAAEATRSLAGEASVVALGVVGALARQPSVAAARALDALSDAAELPRDVRKEARRALHRVRAAGVHLEAPAIVATLAVPGLSDLVVGEAWATSIGGGGVRALWQFAERAGSDDSGVAVGLVLSDTQGVVEVTSMDSSRRRFHRLLDQSRAEDPHADFVSLPPEYGRQLAREALDLNASSGTAVPRALGQYRDLVVAEAPPEQALAYEEISPTEVRLNPQWLEESPQLLDLHEVRHWLLPPDELGPLVEEIEALQKSRIELPGESQEQRRDHAMERAVERLFPAPVKSALKRRLEETAYVLLRKDRPLDARRALAAATALGEQPAPTSHPLLIGVTAPATSGNPFLSALVGTSLSLALAMMSQSGLPEGETDADPAR